MAGFGRKKGDAELILALAAGRTIKAAAAAAGIGERTARRRLEDPEFRQRVTVARGDMVGRALGRMAHASTAAVATLKRLLGAKADTVKLGAARAILELGAKLRESVEMEERIAALEHAGNSKPDPAPGSVNGTQTWGKRS